MTVAEAFLLVLFPTLYLVLGRVEFESWLRAVLAGAASLGVGVASRYLCDWHFWGMVLAQAGLFVGWMIWKIARGKYV